MFSPLEIPPAAAMVCKSTGKFLPLIALVALFGQYADGAVVTRDINTTLQATDTGTYALDLNLDGTSDFTFTAFYTADPSFELGFATVDIPFASSNGLVVEATTGDGFPTAALLLAGQGVSVSDLFSGPNDQSNLVFFTPFDPTTGNFEGTTGFVGLRFDTADGVHYGYAQITVNSRTDPTNPLGLTIGTVGYETTVGQAIAIPEPSSATFAGLAAAFTLGFRRNRSRRGYPFHPRPA